MTLVATPALKELAVGSAAFASVMPQSNRHIRPVQRRMFRMESDSVRRVDSYFRLCCSLEPYHGFIVPGWAGIIYDVGFLRLVGSGCSIIDHPVTLSHGPLCQS